MEHHLEARIAEARGERAKVVREQARETVRGLCSQSLLERAAVLPWQDPGLERAARRVRHERRERRREGHDALFGGDLLAEHVAVETAPLVLIVLTRLAKLAPHLIEHDRDRAHARVRMVRWHARLLMAPRDEDVADLTVALEVHEPIAVHPQHHLECLGRHRRERVVMAWRFDDELGGAARREPVEHPHALAYQLPLDPEIRIRLRHDTNGPARAVRRRAVLAVRRDLWPREVLRAGTVGAVARRRPLALGADQHPVASRRVLPQLVHASLRNEVAVGRISTMIPMAARRPA